MLVLSLILLNNNNNLYCLCCFSIMKRLFKHNMCEGIIQKYERLSGIAKICGGFIGGSLYSWSPLQHEVYIHHCYPGSKCITSQQGEKVTFYFTRGLCSQTLVHV